MEVTRRICLRSDFKTCPTKHVLYATTNYNAVSPESPLIYVHDMYTRSVRLRTNLCARVSGVLNIRYIKDTLLVRVPTYTVCFDLFDKSCDSFRTLFSTRLFYLTLNVYASKNYRSNIKSLNVEILKKKKKSILFNNTTSHILL